MPHIFLDEIESKEVFPGHIARLIHSEKMTVGYYEISEGASAPAHDHPNEQIVNVLAGEYRLTVDGEPHVLRPGSVFIVPSGVTHEGQALTDCRLLDIFSPVREDLR